MPQGGLRKSVSSFLEDFRVRVHERGEDLYAHVFGQAWSIFRTVSFELLRLYWLLVIHVFGVYVVPYFMIYGLIVESRVLGSLAFSLAAMFGVTVFILTIGYFVLQLTQDEVDRTQSSRTEGAAQMPESGPQEFVRRGVVAAIFGSARRIVRTVVSVFSPRPNPNQMAGFIVRLSTISLFMSLLLIENFGENYFSEHTVIKRFTENILFQVPIQVAQYLVINPVMITLSFFLSFFPGWMTESLDAHTRLVWLILDSAFVEWVLVLCASLLGLILISFGMSWLRRRLTARSLGKPQVLEAKNDLSKSKRTSASDSLKVDFKSTPGDVAARNTRDAEGTPLEVESSDVYIVRLWRGKKQYAHLAAHFDRLACVVAEIEDRKAKSDLHRGELTEFRDRLYFDYNVLLGAVTAKQRGDGNSQDGPIDDPYFKYAQVLIDLVDNGKLTGGGRINAYLPKLKFS